MIELERKFLVPDPPDWLERCRCERIEQAYLCVSGDWEFRARRIGDRCVLTAKHGSGERRTEVEVEIAEGQFEALSSLSEAGLVKRRCYVDAPAGTIEVDVYEGPLLGLVVAEVEFDSQSDADSFAPPRWLGAEVTDDARYANQGLARDGLPAAADSG